jgi:putative FmdB family regulatory protein
MPIYEYRCRKCAHEFELFQKISDTPAKKCPECGGTVDRLVSSTSFSLKGHGWYKDGYSSKKPEEKKKKKKKSSDKK